MDITPIANNLAKLLKIKETETSVEIVLGWKTLANLELEDKKWYVTILGRDMCVVYGSKEDAFNRVVKYFIDT